MSVLNVQEKVKEMLLPKCGGTHVHVCGRFVGKTLYGYWPIQSNKLLEWIWSCIIRERQ
jgi:hypothetical protein